MNDRTASLSVKVDTSDALTSIKELKAALGSLATTDVGPKSGAAGAVAGGVADATKEVSKLDRQIQLTLANSDKANKALSGGFRDIADTAGAVSKKIKSALTFSVNDLGLSKAVRVGKKDLEDLSKSLSATAKKTVEFAKAGIDVPSIVKGAKEEARYLDNRLRGLEAFYKRAYAAQKAYQDAVNQAGSSGIKVDQAVTRMLQQKVGKAELAADLPAIQTEISALRKAEVEAKYTDALRTRRTVMDGVIKQRQEENRIASNTLEITRRQLEMAKAADALISAKYTKSQIDQHMPGAYAFAGKSSELEASIAHMERIPNALKAYAKEGGSGVAALQSAYAASAAKSAGANEMLTASHLQVAKAEITHTNVTKNLSLAQAEYHAVARGLSGSLGQLWMTYGMILPLMAGAALGAGFKTAAKEGAEFAYQLTFIKALGDDTAESMAKVGEAVLNLAPTSMRSPLEMANGLRILKQAGLELNDALMALPVTMNLATTGEMSMENAALTLVGVMEAFSLKVTDMTRIGDLFAKGASLSQTSVEGLTAALRTSSVVHEQYGASIEDSVAALTMLAKVNIQGTAAGTAYKNLLKDLYTPSKKAADTLKSLNISVFDKQTGEARRFVDVVYDLKAALAGLDPESQKRAMGNIFDQRGARQFIAMISQSREEFNKFVDDLSSSEGFMAKVTSQLEMTTKGRFQQAMNTFSAEIIRAFNATSGPMRELSDSLKNLFESKTFVLGLNLVVEGMANLAKAILYVTPLVTGFVIAWAGFKGLSLISSGLSAAGSAITGVGIAVDAVKWSLGQASTGAMAFSDALKASKAVDFTNVTNGALAASGAINTAGKSTGALAAALSFLTNPLTYVVAGIVAMGYALYKTMSYLPKATQDTMAFADALTREAEKLGSEVKLLEKRNSLMVQGMSLEEADRKSSSKAEIDKINRRLAEIGDEEAKLAKKPIGSAASRFGVMPSIGIELTNERKKLKEQLGIIVAKSEEVESMLTEKARKTTHGALIEAESDLVKVRKTAEDTVKTYEKLGKKVKVNVDYDSVYKAMHALQEYKGAEGAREHRELKSNLEMALSEARARALGTGEGKLEIADERDATSRFKAEKSSIKEEFDERNRLALEYYNSEKRIIDATYKEKVIKEDEFIAQRKRNEGMYREAVADSYAKAQEGLRKLGASSDKDSQRIAVDTETKRLDALILQQEVADNLNRKEELRLQLVKAQGDAMEINRRLDKQLVEFMAPYRKEVSKSMNASPSARQEAEANATSAAEAAYDKYIANAKASLLVIEEQASSTQALIVKQQELDDATGMCSAQMEELQKRQESLTLVQDELNKSIGQARDKFYEQGLAAAKLAGDLADKSQSLEDGFKKTFEGMTKSANNFAELAKDSVNIAFNSMSSSATKFFLTGKLGFKDMVSSMLAEATKMLANKAVMMIFGTLLSLVPSAAPAAPAGGTGISAPSGGGVTVPAYPWAKGGAFASGTGLSEHVNTIRNTPTFFTSNTPPISFHAKGNVFGEAGYEGIFPIGRNSNGELGVKAIGGAGRGAGNTVNLELNLTVVEGNKTAETSSQTGTSENNSAYMELMQVIASKSQEVIINGLMPGGVIYSAIKGG